MRPDTRHTMTHQNTRKRFKHMSTTSNDYPKASSTPPGATVTTATPTHTDPPLINPASATARTVYETQPALRAVRPSQEFEQNVKVVTPRDRVRWGPIMAGLLSALATFAILTLLGAAIGATTLDANGGVPPAGTTTNQFGSVASIWAASAHCCHSLSVASSLQRQRRLVAGAMAGSTAQWSFLPVSC